MLLGLSKNAAATVSDPPKNALLLEDPTPSGIFEESKQHSLELGIKQKEKKKLYPLLFAKKTVQYGFHKAKRLEEVDQTIVT